MGDRVRAGGVGRGPPAVWEAGVLAAREGSGRQPLPGARLRLLPASGTCPGWQSGHRLARAGPAWAPRRSQPRPPAPGPARGGAVSRRAPVPRGPAGLFWLREGCGALGPPPLPTLTRGSPRAWDRDCPLLPQVRSSVRPGPLRLAYYTLPVQVHVCHPAGAQQPLADRRGQTRRPGPGEGAVCLPEWPPLSSPGITRGRGLLHAFTSTCF